MRFIYFDCWKMFIISLWDQLQQQGLLVEGQPPASWSEQTWTGLGVLPNEQVSKGLGVRSMCGYTKTSCGQTDTTEKITFLQEVINTSGEGRQLLILPCTSPRLLYLTWRPSTAVSPCRPPFPSQLHLTASVRHHLSTTWPRASVHPPLRTWT